MGKTFQANIIQKKAEVTMLVSVKVDFRAKNINRNKKGNFIMLKGSILKKT